MPNFVNKKGVCSFVKNNLWYTPSCVTHSVMCPQAVHNVISRKNKTFGIILFKKILLHLHWTSSEDAKYKVWIKILKKIN